MRRVIPLAPPLLGPPAPTKAPVGGTPGGAERGPRGCAAGAESRVSVPVSVPDHSETPVPSRTSPAPATTPGSRAGYQTVDGEPVASLPVQATTTTSCA